ncbi:MAG: hypothetical protein NVS3B21_28980 [Acidimicrobiales bacterium]
MTRPSSDQRLEQVVLAAIAVFSARGLVSARMSDIAERAGVSQGLLYNYFESKDALLQYVVERIVAGQPVPVSELPFPAPEPGATVRTLGRVLRDGFALGQTLELAVHARSPGDPHGELRGILVEFYDSVSRWRDVIRIVERSAQELPELRLSHFGKGRRKVVDRLGEYLQMRIDDGLFRPVPDATVAARLLIETVSWFANHRLEDPDSADIDDAVAKETVVSMLCAAVIL